MFPISIEIPTPANYLGKGATVHHWAWRKAYNKLREDAAWLWTEQRLERFAIHPYTGPVTMNAHWKYRSGKTPDDDNVWTRCGAIRDALEDAGIIENDSQVRTGVVTFERIPKSQQPTVVVTIDRRDA